MKRFAYFIFGATGPLIDMWYGWRLVAVYALIVIAITAYIDGSEDSIAKKK